MPISLIFKNGHNVAIKGDQNKYAELRAGMTDPSAVIDAETARYGEKTSLRGLEIVALQAIEEERWEKLEAAREKAEAKQRQMIAAMEKQATIGGENN